MKTRILKKINDRVRIVEDNDGNFLVQQRKLLGLRRGMSKWKTLNTYSTYKKAVEKRNMHVVMVIIRDLGFQHVFVNRRKARKQKRV